MVIVVFDVFSVADTVSKADGGTFDGAVTLAGGVSGVCTTFSNTVDNRWYRWHIKFRAGVNAVLSASGGNYNMLLVDGGNHNR